jgi:hypothetical protein
MCAFKNNMDNKKNCTRQCDLCKLKKYSTTFNAAVNGNIVKESNLSVTKRQDLQIQLLNG